jgi:hypothetical protein
MSRRKKRGPDPSQSERKKGSDGSHAAQSESPPLRKKQIPPAHPPRRNVPLLVTCAALVAIWLVLLIYLAATS